LKVVREVEGVRLGRAKEIVDSSATWADMRESNERIRSLAVKAVEESEDLD
jgi:ribosomal protein L7/L12